MCVFVCCACAHALIARRDAAIYNEATSSAGEESSTKGVNYRNARQVGASVVAGAARPSMTSALRQAVLMVCVCVCVYVCPENIEFAT